MQYCYGDSKGYYSGSEKAVRGTSHSSCPPEQGPQASGTTVAVVSLRAAVNRFLPLHAARIGGVQSATDVALASSQ